MPWPALATANCENGASVAVASRKTRVSKASRIDSAISFGVRCRASRLRPSRSCGRGRTRPGLLVTRTTSQSDSTRVPPVTDEKSPPASRSTGADSPVIALSSTDATPSMTSPSAGIDVARLRRSTTSSRRSAARRNPSELLLAPAADAACLRLHVAPRRAQRIGLRLAAPFGDRLGEVREQHREPQPRGDGEDEPRLADLGWSRRAHAATAMSGREDAAHEDDEHHRVADLHAAGSSFRKASRTAARNDRSASAVACCDGVGSRRWWRLSGSCHS